MSTKISDHMMIIFEELLRKFSQYTNTKQCVKKVHTYSHN